VLKVEWAFPREQRWGEVAVKSPPVVTIPGEGGTEPPVGVTGKIKEVEEAEHSTIEVQVQGLLTSSPWHWIQEVGFPS
jgi:hypothetical protein